MGWLLITLLLLILTALPATFAAVAVRPSPTTVWAAALPLLALPLVVILINPHWGHCVDLSSHEGLGLAVKVALFFPD